MKRTWTRVLFIVLMLTAVCSILAQDAAQLQEQMNAVVAKRNDLVKQMEEANQANDRNAYTIAKEQYDELGTELEALKNQAAQLQAQGDQANQIKLEINASLTAIKMGQYDQAIVHADKAIEMDPNNAKAFSSKAFALKKLKRYPEAEVAYKKTIELDPEDTKTIVNLGILYSDQAKYSEAISQLNLAVEKDPGMAKAHYMIGNAYNKQKNYTKSSAAFKAATEADPNYYLAHNALGVALIELGKYNDAIQSLQTAIALRPNFGNAHYRLAKAYNAVGRHQEVIQAGELALEHSKSLKGAVYVEIGEAYEKLGNKAKALEAYEAGATDRRYKKFCDYKIEQLKK